MRNYYALFSCGTIASVDMRWLLFLLVGLLPTLVQAQTITGTVFRDFNTSGAKDNTSSLTAAAILSQFSGLPPISSLVYFLQRKGSE